MKKREEKDVKLYESLNVLSDNGHEMKLTQRHDRKRETWGQKE